MKYILFTKKFQIFYTYINIYIMSTCHFIVYDYIKNISQKHNIFQILINLIIIFLFFH